MLLPERETDAVLLARSAADSEAFATFYRRYADAVLAFCRARVSDPETAMDLTAETFARALQGLPRYTPHGDSAAGWILTIARNTLIDSVRRARVADDARQALGLAPLVLTDPDIDALEERARVGYSALRKALDGLPDDQRVAVLAHVVEERSHEEIAADLGCSAAVVRKRSSRGLVALRRVLLKENG